MPNLHLSQRIIWSAIALLLAACTIPPPPPLPPQLTLPSSQTLPVLPTDALPAGSDNPVSLTPEQQQLLAGLPMLGTAPALQTEIWLNSEPLHLADLQGKVVMVEFWTYGCINCRNVIPAMQNWHAHYADDGLVIIGVHTPEFAYERELANVEAAIAELGVTWPVTIDNDRATWRAYANHYWPAAYLIDKQGQIRLVKIGEGNYAYTESVIQALLAEPGA